MQKIQRFDTILQVVIYKRKISRKKRKHAFDQEKKVRFKKKKNRKHTNYFEDKNRKTTPKPISHFKIYLNYMVKFIKEF